jgi:hypothetical protein
MTSLFWGPGEKRYNRHRSGLRCTRIPTGVFRPPGREVSEGGIHEVPAREVFAPGPDQSGKYFQPTEDPAGKNSGAILVCGPGIFFVATVPRPKYSGSSGSGRENFPAAGTNCAEPVGPGFIAGSPSPMSAACVLGGAGLVGSGGTRDRLIPRPSSIAGTGRIGTYA